MSLDKRKILDALAGKPGADLNFTDEERAEAQAWLSNLADVPRRLNEAARSGSLDRWIDAGVDTTDEVQASQPLVTVLRDGSEASTGLQMKPFELPTPGEAMAERIAIAIYGDANQPFRLTLHFQPLTTDMNTCEAELEISPPPKLAAMTLIIEFVSGHQESFGINIPVSPRPSTRSTTSAPMDRDALTFTRGAWLDGTWPPVFRFG
ncbi:MAG: hypothetical protein ACKO5E_09855 [bacterium]